MKGHTAFLATLAILGLAGCASTCCQSLSVRMSGLQQGMSKEQVIELLGKPSDAGTGKIYAGPNATMSDGFSELFRYTRTEQRQSKHWLVVFVQGKVTEYGSLSGDLRTRYGGVFSDK